MVYITNYLNTPSCLGFGGAVPEPLPKGATPRPPQPDRTFSEAWPKPNQASQAQQQALFPVTKVTIFLNGLSYDLRAFYRHIIVCLEMKNTNMLYRRFIRHNWIKAHLNSKLLPVSLLNWLVFRHKWVHGHAFWGSCHIMLSEAVFDLNRSFCSSHRICSPLKISGWSNIFFLRKIT